MWLEKTVINLTAQHSKKEIFLAGYYLSFILLMTVAILLDIYIENTMDAWIECAVLVPTLVSLWYYYRYANMDLAIYALVALTTLITYALLVSNRFNISVFHIIVPLGYFLLFSLKLSLLITFVHEAIVVLIYAWGRHLYPENIMLHSSTMLTAAIIASLTVILFGIMYHISVENSYRRLEQSDHQKAILLNEVHHRVKNNLNIMSSILGLQVIGEDDKKIKQILQKNRQRIHSIAMVHEALYKHEDFEYIDIVAYLSNVVQANIAISSKKIELSIESSYPVLPFDMALHIGMITNELVTNSLKHAFEKSEGSISIKIEESDSEYLYHYQDSGNATLEIETLQAGRGLGMKLIEMMVEQLDSRMKISGERGMKYTMWKPKNV